MSRQFGRQACMPCPTSCRPSGVVCGHNVKSDITDMPFLGRLLLLCRREAKNQWTLSYEPLIGTYALHCDLTSTSSNLWRRGWRSALEAAPIWASVSGLRVRASTTRSATLSKSSSDIVIARSVDRSVRSCSIKRRMSLTASLSSTDNSSSRAIRCMLADREVLSSAERLDGGDRLLSRCPSMDPRGAGDSLGD